MLTPDPLFFLFHNYPLSYIKLPPASIRFLHALLRAKRAFESFARLFKGGRVQGRRPWSPAAAGETPFMLS